MANESGLGGWTSWRRRPSGRFLLMVGVFAVSVLACAGAAAALSDSDSDSFGDWQRADPVGGHRVKQDVSFRPVEGTGVLAEASPHRLDLIDDLDDPTLAWEWIKVDVRLNPPHGPIGTYLIRNRHTGNYLSAHSNNGRQPASTSRAPDHVWEVSFVVNAALDGHVSIYNPAVDGYLALGSTGAVVVKQMSADQSRADTSAHWDTRITPFARPPGDPITSYTDADLFGEWTTTDTLITFEGLAQVPPAVSCCTLGETFVINDNVRFSVQSGRMYAGPGPGGSTVLNTTEIPTSRNPLIIELAPGTGAVGLEVHSVSSSLAPVEVTAYSFNGSVAQLYLAGSGSEGAFAGFSASDGIQLVVVGEPRQRRRSTFRVDDIRYEAGEPVFG